MIDRLGQWRHTVPNSEHALRQIFPHPHPFSTHTAMNTPTTVPEILTHLDAGVMTLTINRLERKNAITAVMYAAMADALAGATQRSNGAQGDAPA